jgi:hypothetical protein
MATATMQIARLGLQLLYIPCGVWSFCALAHPLIYTRYIVYIYNVCMCMYIYIYTHIVRYHDDGSKKLNA